MGSSAKRKKEKRQDFQKPKLKVGKAKPKPSNQTDTSFRSKAIVLNQQSLNVEAPTVVNQFNHHVSLLSSRSDAQRKESLAFLASYVHTRPTDTPLPQPVGSLLDKLCPLILDGSSGVRVQLLKTLQSFREEELRDHVSKILPFIRAGMTHLSRDIRLSTTDALAWLVNAAGEEVVSCPGGWVKTLESFVTLLGWKVLNDTGKWSSSKTILGSDTKMVVRFLQVLSQFMSAGFETEESGIDATTASMVSSFPLWHTSATTIPTRSNAFNYLDLFGIPSSEESQILDDREERILIFRDRFREPISTGIEAAKQEGGELGRAAGLLTKALKLADSEG